MEQHVISPQVFVFLYILKIVLVHFKYKLIPYHFLLFTRVIANTTPNSVSSIPNICLLTLQETDTDAGRLEILKGKRTSTLEENFVTHA